MFEFVAESAASYFSFSSANSSARAATTQIGISNQTGSKARSCQNPNRENAAQRVVRALRFTAQNRFDINRLDHTRQNRPHQLLHNMLAAKMSFDPTGSN